MGVILHRRGTRSLVRGRRIAGLAVLVLLLFAAPAHAANDPLQRYAEGTWASFVGDDRRADRPARRLREVRRHAQHADLADQHRRVPVERGVGRAAGDHRPPRDGRAPRPDADDARADGARRRPASTSTGTTSAPATTSPTTPGGGEVTPWLSSVDNALARGRAARRRESRARAARAGAAAVRLDGLRLLLRRRPQPDPLPLRDRDRQARRAATTRSSPRAGSRATSGSRRASCRRASTTARSARSPTTATSSRRKPLGDTRSYLGETVFEGALPTRARG